MTLWIFGAVAWVALALGTLLTVVNGGNALLAALIAWVGGLITYRLGNDVYRWAKAWQ